MLRNTFDILPFKPFGHPTHHYLPYSTQLVLPLNSPSLSSFAPESHSMLLNNAQESFTVMSSSISFMPCLPNQPSMPAPLSTLPNPPFQSHSAFLTPSSSTSAQPLFATFGTQSDNFSRTVPQYILGCFLCPSGDHSRFKHILEDTLHSAEARI